VFGGRDKVGKRRMGIEGKEGRKSGRERNLGGKGERKKGVLGEKKKKEKG